MEKALFLKFSTKIFGMSSSFKQQVVSLNNWNLGIPGCTVFKQFEIGTGDWYIFRDSCSFECNGKSKLVKLSILLSIISPNLF